jgi:hypothetical protein
MTLKIGGSMTSRTGFDELENLIVDRASTGFEFRKESYMYHL